MTPAVCGVGIDLVQVARIGRALERHGERFAQRVLCAAELEGLAASVRPAAYLAKRFAAKEAFFKAIGTGLGGGVGWQDLRIAHHPGGRPLLEIRGRSAERMSALGARRCHLSITDERDYAIAVVVLSA